MTSDSSLKSALVKLRSGWGVPIPWERGNLPASTRVFALEPEDGKLPRWRKRMRLDYGTLPKCVTLAFDGMREASRLLRDERALDACYRANAELMRRGASMYRRFNNPYLTQAILERL